ncbi:UNVERIFIED_ORG: PAS domain S-box protein [Shinella sp. XGS7]|nr:PAS domain S-box protein [Shinella sp. XGS7]
MDSIPSQRPRPRPALVPAVLAFLGGLALTIAASLWLQAGAEAAAEAEFERLSERVEREVQRRLQTPVYGLNGARGMFAATAEVRGREFRAYVESRDMAREFPGVRGFGFIERVREGELSAFVAAQRREPGAREFEVQRLGRQDPHYIIRYVEPLADNRPAWGLDLGFDARRREVLEQAMLSGETRLSANLVLLQDERRSPGFLLVVPLYRHGTDPQNETQRESNLRGFVYAPLVAREIFAGLTDVVDGKLAVAVRESGVTVYASEEAEGSRYSAEHHLAFGGRELRLQIKGLPAFERSAVAHDAQWVAAAGLLLSAALGLTAWSLASGRERAERMARDMTRELERLARVARGTANAVFSTDAQQRIDWVNEGFTRISGYSAEEALGRTPGELLGSGQADPATLQTLAEAVRQGRGCRVEILNRRKDGQLYWVETELQPLHDDLGQLSGFIEIALDISERKRSAELLERERERLSRIIEGTGAGTWELNLQTDEVRFNERWAEMIGYELSELGTLSAQTWDRLAHPEDLQQAQQLLQRHLRGELDTYQAEVRLRHKNGRWIWLQTRGKLISRDAQGQPLWVAGIHLDIDARKTAEQALRESEAVLERGGRIAAVGGWQLDLRSQRLHWTDQTFRIHDLVPGQHQPGFEEALEYYDLPGRLAIRAALRRLYRQRENVDLELRMTTALGREIWVRAVGEPEWEGDRVVRINGILQDITQRRALEDSMRRNNEVLSSVLDNLPCGLTLFDGSMQLMLHNSRWAQLYALPADFFTGEPVSVDKVAGLMHARREYGEISEAQALEAARQRARDAMQAPHYWERSRPGGLILEMRSAPLPGGGFVTTYTDVSEQRRAAVELAQALALLRAVLDAASQVLIVATDRERRIRVFNRGAELMLGYRAEELVGRHSTALLHPPEDLEAQGRALSAETGREIGGFEALIHPSQLGRELECVYQRKDGSRFPALRVVTEMRGPDGQLHGYLGVAYDITRRKEAEAVLQEARLAAEQASAAKSQFLANMSHEIRTPMNAILGMLRLLGRTPLDERQRDYASKTERAARALLALLNDILDFSKIEAGRLVLDPQPFAPAQLMADVEVILRANLGDKPLALHLELDPALPPGLLGDAIRLQQVLVNLGGNAIKFTPRGEVCLSLSHGGESAEGVLLNLRVSDTGIGIAPEHQQKIFAGFTQAEASTTRRFGGTGLGLAISQRLVQAMGGMLTLRSAPGEGSEFSFSLRLPRAEAPEATPSEAPAAPGERLAGLTLLVVEDNANNQQVAQELLEYEGALVSLAGDGQQALDMLRAAPLAYDLVLMDVQMPVMDGYAATRAIRADASLAHLPVVAITANAMAVDRLAARAAGMDAHVGKPFELEHLVAVIRHQLGRHPVPAAAAPQLPARDWSAAPLQRAQVAGLDLPGALRRLMGRTELLARLARGFAETAASVVPRLREQLAHGAEAGAQEARASLHTFKGLAATLGAERLAGLAREGETLLQGGMGLPEAWLQALDEEQARGCAALLAAVQALTPPETPEPAAATAAPQDPAAAAGALRELARLLGQSDMAALGALEQLRRGPGTGLALDDLEDAVQRLDFRRALQYCQQLIGDLTHE